MIKVYNNTKIFVYCPAGTVTGGAELLHQIVSFLRNQGKEAYIIYYGGKSHEVPSDYNKYNIQITDYVEDRKENIEVFIESQFNWINRYKHTQKLLWWISVDHFYTCSTHYLKICDLFKYSPRIGIHTFLKRTIQLFKGKNDFKNNISLKDLSSIDAVSAYQSEYAQNFLQNNGFREIVALKDYINVEHTQNFSTKNKENIILYNPKKGIKFTRQLIKLAPDLQWVPIINMSRAEVINNMQKAKLYIDFGYHPGKDRLPRECAANGCCIITGSRGSAGFFEDVAIENKYKFNEKISSKEDIIATIRETLDNYDTYIQDFKYYRHIISLEKQEFEMQISNIFLI